MADAIGYLTMGGIFAANMTGNTVLTGMSAAKGDLEGTIHHAGPLLFFFLGALSARMLLRAVKSAKAPLAFHAIVLAIATFLIEAPSLAIAVVAFAMGLQASAITRFGRTAASTVVVTSTIARLADAAVDRWAGRPRSDPTPGGDPRLLLLTWGCYLFGAIAAAAFLPLMTKPLLVPTVLAVLVLLF